MYYVECGVSGGLRASEATVSIEDIDGARAFLRVERGFIHQPNGQAYLPIGLIYVDQQVGRALIELPHEADSGVNRLWVTLKKLKLAPQLEQLV